MSTVLVTGGAGFIGSHVADLLTREGHTVVVLDDLSGGFRDNVTPRARFVEGSILDYALVERIFSEHSFEYVFHLAAYAAEGLSHFVKRFNYQNNVIGSVNLINQSILNRVKCFVFTSSIAVYGAGQNPLSEFMRPDPQDPYGIAKFTVELELEASHKMFGLPYIIFRPHNVYGERQNLSDKYRNVIGIFMSQALKGGEMPIFGDGTQRRAFTYINDVAPILASSIQNPRAYQQVFNIGADLPHTVNDIATWVAESLGIPRRVIHRESRDEVHAAYSDHSKLRSYFKIGPDTDIKEGLARMAEWAKKQPLRESQPFLEIEINEKLPRSWVVDS